MPQRSNDFQAMVHRLEKILHPTTATVEESAMVKNHAHGRREEIDILITFSFGDRTYRTAVQVQDRSRKGGPGWIRDLGSQRRHCRLDRMVAVHSKGFTRSAIETAKCESVELITPGNATDADMLAAVDPITHIEMCFVQHNSLLMHFREQHEPHLDPAVSSTGVVVPGRNIVTLDRVRELIAELLKPRGEEVIKADPILSGASSTMWIPFVVPLAAGTLLQFADGRTLNLTHLSGDLTIYRLTASFDRTEAGEYRGQVFRNATGENSAGSASVTMVHSSPESGSMQAAGSLTIRDGHWRMLPETCLNISSLCPSL